MVFSASLVKCIKVISEQVGPKTLHPLDSKYPKMQCLKRQKNTFYFVVPSDSKDPLTFNEMIEPERKNFRAGAVVGWKLISFKREVQSVAGDRGPSELES
jgi:hypothetical protein